MLSVEAKATTHLEDIAEAYDGICYYHQKSPELLALGQLHALTYLVQLLWCYPEPLARREFFLMRSPVCSLAIPEEASCGCDPPPPGGGCDLSGHVKGDEQGWRMYTGSRKIKYMVFTRLLLAVFACIAPLFWVDCAGAEDFMAKGRELEARTLYGPAIAEYQRAIREDPASAAEAHYRIGVLSDKLGNAEGAAREFRAALQADPHHAEARRALAAFHLNRGVAARQQRRLDEALRELQQAVGVDPGSSTAHLELGRAYEEAGRLAEAVQEYHAAVQADPKNLAAQLRLGQGYNAQQQYALAVPAFQAVLAENPDRAEAYAGLGVAYVHQGQREEARKAFEMAIRKYLVAGRRDLALQVKAEADALMPPTPQSPARK